MEDYKVLITTSGTGSRLGKLTDFTNKCLVRASDKPTISHIIEYYPPKTAFVITLGHFGSYVKQFLELAYPGKDITFVNVDKFEGDGSSLGYSILQASALLQCPFIFHAGDTILTRGDRLPALHSNWCAGAHNIDTSQYRTLTVNAGLVKRINKKGEINFDYPYIGVCGIKDYKLFWKELEGLPNHHALSDVHVINQMIKTVDFRFHEIKTWLDTGNSTQLDRTRSFFGHSIEVLDKEHESIYFFEDFVIKFFSNTQVNLNRVKRASNLYPLVPKVLQFSDNFFKYKKEEGELFSKSVNKSKFLQFLNWSKKKIWLPKFADKFQDKCRRFYIDKSKQRINQYLNGQEDTESEINGELVPGINELFDQIDSDWLCAGVPVQFHGDFILDNIIETKNGFVLIDWRQDFGGDLEVGDIYYDLAKLNHNLTINHFIVDQKSFSHQPARCHILCNSILLECKELLRDFTLRNGYDFKKVELLTAIIWINMAPLHHYPFNDFLFNFGKYNLHKQLNEPS